MAACAVWPDGIQLLQLKAGRPSGCYSACVTHLCRVLASQFTFSHTCVCFEQRNVVWHNHTAVLSIALLPPLQDCFCTLPALWGLFCLSFSLCPLPPPPYTGCDAPSAVRFPLYPLGLVFSMLPRPSSQPGAFTLERKATFYFHIFL